MTLNIKDNQTNKKILQTKNKSKQAKKGSEKSDKA